MSQVPKEESADRSDDTPPEMTLLKLYAPVTADLYLYEHDGERQEKPAAVELSGPELLRFQNSIAEAVEKLKLPEEAERGIMCWYGGEDSVNRKVHSVMFRTESRGQNIWCVADCRINGELTDSERETLREYIGEQLSEGFSEGLETGPVSIGPDKLYIHLWQPGQNWSVKTEQERFEPAPAAKQPEMTRKRQPVR